MTAATATPVIVTTIRIGRWLGDVDVAAPCVVKP